MLEVVECRSDEHIGEMSSLPAGQEDSLASAQVSAQVSHAPKPVSEVATGLLQFAAIFTASTGGTFNVSQAAGWTGGAAVCSWDYVSCNRDDYGPGVYLNLSRQSITGGNDIRTTPASHP